MGDLGVYAVVFLGLILMTIGIIRILNPKIRQKMSEAFKESLLFKLRTQPLSSLVTTPKGAALVAEQLAIRSGIERGLGWAYAAWYRIPEGERMLLCVPACAIFSGIFFYANFLVFLAQQSFDGIGLLIAIMQFLCIYVIYISIFLLMSRFRFKMSGLLSITYLFILPALVAKYLPESPANKFSELVMQGVFHMLSAFIIARTWTKAHANRPGRIVKLWGVTILSGGLCNIYLAIFMLFKIPHLADQKSSEEILSLPIYHAFEPFLRSIMAPLHLHIGDLMPENIIFTVLLLAWGSLLFLFGGYVWLGKYDAIADIPGGVNEVGANA